MILANRIKQIEPSPTLAISAEATAMKKAGVDVINLAAGEPDFPTPEHICNAAIESIKNNETRYTPVSGTPGLIKAIQHKFLTENNLEYSDKEVIATTGAKQAIYNCMQVLLNEGDEVIIPAPYWVSYPDMVKLAGGVPVAINAGLDQNYKITADQLEKAITNKTKMIILNSPNNPTGAIYSKEELISLAKVIAKNKHVYVLSDDIYEHINFTSEKFYNIANVDNSIKDRVIVINGVSKSYSMTGWRLGYAAGHKEVIGAMNKIQGQSTSNACSITQAAAIAALTGEQDFLINVRENFSERNKITTDSLNKIKGINCNYAEGAFYTFFDASEFISMVPEVNNDLELAKLLLTEAKIALVPGSAFGLDDHLRISYALDKDKLIEALDRMTKCLIAKLK